MVYDKELERSERDLEREAEADIVASNESVPELKKEPEKVQEFELKREVSGNSADPDKENETATRTSANEKKRLLSPLTSLATALALSAAVAAGSFFMFPADDYDYISEKDNEVLYQQMNTLAMNGGFQGQKLSQAGALQALRAMSKTTQSPNGSLTLNAPANPTQVYAFIGEPFAADLEKKIEDGEYTFAAFQVYDSQCLDGDIVQISGYGFSYVVPLDHSPTTVMIPVPTNGSTPVTVNGWVDGGGGVTVGVINNGTPQMAPVLKPGASFTVPVR
jgi:hypothetical protein